MGPISESRLRAARLGGYCSRPQSDAVVATKVRFVSKEPAILLNIDGDPIWSPIRENDLKFAVNTNWDLFQHAPTNTLYLCNDSYWHQASDVKGAWTPIEKFPSSFKKLPKEDNWAEVRENLKGKPPDRVPTVFVSTQQAELIKSGPSVHFFLA